MLMPEEERAAARTPTAAVPNTTPIRTAIRWPKPPPALIPGRRRLAEREVPRMVRKKRPHKTSPRTPSRVKKRRPKRKTKGHAHHHPELVGLGLAGLGVFLAAILWFGFNGGPVKHLADAAIGVAAYLMPLVLIPLGAMIVTKSSLVDVRPFRLGLGVALTGLMLTLGTAHGGLLGDGLESLVALAL
ncbi:MAG: hypothetical protein JWO17_2540, partial [Actinomycetia bacterium]|nr:hypothetical protein [Actinomycetes bacterium]